MGAVEASVVATTAAGSSAAADASVMRTDAEGPDAPAATGGEHTHRDAPRTQVRGLPTCNGPALLPRGRTALLFREGPDLAGATFPGP